MTNLDAFFDPFSWSRFAHAAPQHPLTVGAAGPERFPFRVTIWREDDAALQNIPAAYKPTPGGVPGALQVGARMPDRIELRGWFPQLNAQKTLTLRFGVTEDAPSRDFIINDVAPGDSSLSTTLLIVSDAQ